MNKCLSFLLLFACIHLHAQTPSLQWQKCLGSHFSDYVQCVQPTSDGGYIVTGSSTGFDGGDVMGHASGIDIWIVKLDKYGAVEWRKIVGGNDSEEGAFIMQTPDGGYMLASSTASYTCGITGGHGQFDFWAVKLSSKGDIIWQKQYGGSNSDIARSMALSSDGSYYLSGYTLSNDGDVSGNHGDMDYWVIKIDASGKLLWQKTLGGTGQDLCSGIQTTADGGCVLAGFAASLDGDVTGNHGANDYWVVKLDKNGSMQWQKALGGSMTDLGQSIQLTSDGGYLVSGTANSQDGDISGVHGLGFDAWLVKLDKDGKIVWQKCYGGSNNETAKCLQKTADGGFVFTGDSYSSDGDITCNAGMNDVLLMKISSTGVLEWQKTMGGSGNDDAAFVQPLNDGGFIVAATTSSPELPGYHTPDGGIYDDKFDYWVIKLSAPSVLPPAPVVTIDPATAIVCAGKPASIIASVVNAGVTPIYQWMKNGLPVGSNSSTYTDAGFANNDQVTCLVKAGNNCEPAGLAGSDMITIKLKTSTANPEIKISSDNTAACSCAVITITATVSNAGGAPIYQWMINGNNTGSNSPILVSRQFKDGDVISCLYTDNTNCAASGPVLSNTIKIGGGNGAAPSVTIAASADTICKNTPVTFMASPVNAGTNPVYQWKINNNITGSNDPLLTSSSLAEGDVVSCSIKTDPLFICAAGAGASSNSITMHIMDKLSPAVKIAASAQTICAGSPVSFTATTTGAGNNPVYQWRVNGVNTGINNKVYSSSSLANNDVVSCMISIDPQYSCAVSSQAVSQNIPVTVTSAAPVSISISADRNNVCAGEAITFTAIANNAGTNPRFEWILNGVLLPNTSTTYSSTRLNNGDQLFCRIMPGTGACSVAPDSSNSITTIIKETPVVYLSPADTLVAYGRQVQLNAQVKGSMSSFVWTPADKLMSPLSLTTLTTVLYDNTSYQLVVTNDKGCKAAAIAVVKIGITIDMPNAFSPNNDGVNDIFRIPANAIMDLKDFSVYDRWGNRIFITSNKQQGWDGSCNGQKKSAGIYIYYIRCVINNKEALLKGSFLLVN